MARKTGNQSSTKGMGDREAKGVRRAEDSTPSKATYLTASGRVFIILHSIKLSCYLHISCSSGESDLLAGSPETF